MIYDENSLIADVGGYLGLLLGYSALSIYQTAAEVFKAGVKRVGGGGKKK